jgi:hypothetical protein
MDIPRETKNKVRIDTIRSEGDQSPHPIARASIALGGERGQRYSKLHQSFFTSLGIPLLANADLYRALGLASTHKRKRPPKGGTNTL